MIELAGRLQGVSESATLKLNAAVQAMKAAGEDIVNLTAGEPDFPVPEKAKEAAIRAIRENRSRYTPVPGIPELRERVVRKTNSQHPGLKDPWKISDVVVSNGGKQALFDALMALLNPGDEVLIPAPYWLSYPEMVKLNGGTPRIVPTRFEEGYKLSPSVLRQTLTSKSKVLILNSPSNPTGATYSREEFVGLAEVIRQYPDLLVISDEIYDRILFTDQPFVSSLSVCPDLKEQVITVNGMSKSAAMTGWRIGWSVAVPRFTQAISTIQGQCSSGINSVAQYASVAALDMAEAEFADQVRSFRERRDLTLEILGKAEKLKVMRPDGAFYAFVGVGACLKPGEDSMLFAETLLEEAKVAVVPGAPFGSMDSVRISFATEVDSLRKGCERIVEFVKRRTS